MLPIQLPTGNKHVIFESAQEGVVPLLHYHYHVLHVTLHNVYPEGTPYYGPPRTPYLWECDIACCLRNRDLIHCGYIWGCCGGGASHYQVYPYQPVLDLPMC